MNDVEISCATDIRIGSPGCVTVRGLLRYAMLDRESWRSVAGVKKPRLTGAFPCRSVSFFRFSWRGEGPCRFSCRWLAPEFYWRSRVQWSVRVNTVRIEAH
jgi:hypothetical protein